MMKNCKKAFFALFASSSAALCLSSCSGDADYQRIEGAVWNTMYHITYAGPAYLADSVSLVLKEVELSASVFNPASVVSKINAGETDTIDSHFKTVFLKAKEVNEATGGAFDPTLSPLIDAWGFGKGHKATADTAKIDSIMQFVGMDKLRIKDNVLVKADPRIRINLSAIAKGYGCDAIAAMMERNGVENFLIEIGGEIAAGGKAPSGGKWAIAIDEPKTETNPQTHTAQSIIEITDCGVATSGNYRNFRDEGGQRVGHTISPVTGRPIQTRVISATIVASTAMEADAYATACMVMGEDGAKELAAKQSLPMMIVLSDMTVWMSPQFKSLIKQ